MLAVALALIVPASGCLMTTGDGDKLRDETNDRITQLETQIPGSECGEGSPGPS